MFKKKNIELKNIKIYKILRNISLGFLTLYCIKIINGLFHFIEFYHEFEVSLYNYIVYIFPVFVFIFIFTTMRLDGTKLTRSLIGSIILSIASIFILFISIFLNFCGYYTNDIIYISKYNKDKTVEIRYLDCGAYDSSIPDYKTHLVYNFPPYFYFTRSIDTNDLNLSEWKKYKGLKRKFIR